LWYGAIARKLCSRLSTGDGLADGLNLRLMVPIVYGAPMWDPDPVVARMLDVFYLPSAIYARFHTDSSPLLILLERPALRIVDLSLAKPDLRQAPRFGQRDRTWEENLFRRFSRPESLPESPPES
jgi:hypothetical protein